MPLPLKPLHSPVLWATLMLAACAGMQTEIEPPRLSISQLYLTEATVFEQQYRVQLRIQNPNAFPLHVEGLSYDLYINDQPFMRGISDRAVRIPAFGESSIEVRGISTLFGLARQIEAWERGQTKAFSYRLEGKIQLVDRLSPVTFEYRDELSAAEPATP